MNDQGAWVIGGTTLIGIGVGFFLLPISSLYLVASVMTGIGIGLVIAAFMSRGEERSKDSTAEEEGGQT